MRHTSRKRRLTLLLGVLVVVPVVLLGVVVGRLLTRFRGDVLEPAPSEL